MMCACDKDIGEGFLSHQLQQGVELETQERVPVTLGFQSTICRECRGFPPEPHPVSAIPGRTSKIKRYYWREIAFRQMRLYAKHYPQGGKESGNWLMQPKLEKQALDEIKQLHATCPKYQFDEP